MQCETIGLGGKQLTYDKVRVADSDLRRDWTVQADGCDQRAVRHQKGVFRGHYTPGFEASAFVPCPANAWFLPSDSLGRETINRRAWVTWAANAVGGLTWPPAPRDGFVNPLYFVEWRGRSSDPGTMATWAYRRSSFGLTAFSQFVPPATPTVTNLDNVLRASRLTNAATDSRAAGIAPAPRALPFDSPAAELGR